jgi:hypothetical protein
LLRRPKSENLLERIRQGVDAPRNGPNSGCQCGQVGVRQRNPAPYFFR